MQCSPPNVRMQCTRKSGSGESPLYVWKDGLCRRCRWVVLIPCEQTRSKGTNAIHLKCFREILKGVG